MLFLKLDKALQVLKSNWNYVFKNIWSAIFMFEDVENPSSFPDKDESQLWKHFIDTWLSFKTEIVLLGFLVLTMYSMYRAFWKIGPEQHVQRNGCFVQHCSHVFGHFNGIC